MHELLILLLLLMRCDGKWGSAANVRVASVMVDVVVVALLVVLVVLWRLLLYLLLVHALDHATINHISSTIYPLQLCPAPLNTC